jgi:Leucine-rich repeat (LRR) protein
MLDLEGCKGLKKHHWKSICKILLLKYLSLRNTDVSQLPKKIKNLRCLETLDIRQTAVRAFSTKSIMLPMLRHLFAGQTDSPRNSTDRFKESFATICLPSGLRRMIKLEVLSHVEIAHNVDDLVDVGQLLQLRKLGLVLRGNNGCLGIVLQQVEKLYASLRSLSIRVNQLDRSEPTPDAEEVVELASPPKLLQSLNISGITSGLPPWIAKLDQLAKISLSETYLSEAALRILGKLRILRCLKLRHKSYTGSALGFKEEEYQSLKFLVVEGSDVTKITFDAGAGAQLEMIVWSFAKMDSISGVVHLPRLKKLELNGDCNADQPREAIKEHPNHPDFKHNGQHQHQEAGAVAAASTS